MSTLNSGIIGAPAPGTVAALAAGRGAGAPLFAGTRAGLYRADWLPTAHTGAPAHWQRLPAAPVEILSLGLSPAYAEDATILAGTGRGLFLSQDGGASWQAAHTPTPDPGVLCCCFSPNYRSDGIILAGTLEDGICYTDTRGERWSFRGFGLLDAAVYSLAISPDFAHDELVFAGTESALYYSYNGARAWKPLNFPEDAAPVLSLALSPTLARDQTIYAGTEQQGLYRSADLGTTWHNVDLPATCVNALLFMPEHGSLLAATNSGLFCSDDEGQRWHCLFDRPDIFSLVVSDGRLIAGLANQGAWRAAVRPPAAAGCACVDRATWQPCFTLPARSLTAMAMSARFDSDPVAFLYGSQEGIWRTMDGGLSWSCLNEGLPNLDIRSMALSPHFSQDRVLVAATGDGVLISEDAGDHWSQLAEMPASLVVFSPAGNFIALASPEGEIWLANTLKGTWQRVPIPSGIRGKLVAFMVDDESWFRLARFDQGLACLTIWEGGAGRFEQVLTRPAGSLPVVRFWVPAAADASRTWYASIDQEVWEIRRPKGEGAGSASRIFTVEDGTRILSLTGSATAKGTALLASTGQTLYRSIETGAWTAVHHFGDERVISLTLPSAFLTDATAFALLLGGSFWRGTLQQEGES